MLKRISPLLVVVSILTVGIQSVLAQASLPLYTDNLANAFQNWSWATVNFANTSPVHSGTHSISVVNSGNFQALYLEHPNFSTAPYASVTFWINGGASGGQSVTVHGILNGADQGGHAIGPLAANTWQQITFSLATLGIGNTPNCNGIWVQGNSASAQPVFYVDDVKFVAAPAPALVHLNVNASNALRSADSRWFGVNTATWDGFLADAQTASLMKQNGLTTLRWPGGSTSDGYHWTSDLAHNNTFNQLATNIGANVFITVNYGSGTSNEAAAWVKSVNVTNHYAFKYWEIGNECYGSWETDNNTPAHDPYTYAVRAAGYIALMKAADPTIKIGVVATPGEGSYSNNATHFAVNPRTGTTNYGWTPVMLNTLKNLGVTPDFLVHHVYPQFTSANSGIASDSDPLVLQAGSNWALDAADLRQQLTDYLGANGTNTELLCTENNSDAGAMGRQSTSIVNALYLADNVSQIMKTEFNGYIWWDFRNGSDTSGSFDPTLYGWRGNGDYGMAGGAGSPLYPTFYAEKLMQYFVRGGDTILNPTSDYLLLSAYAARRTNGSLTLLVINKDVTTNFNAQINLTGFVPAGTATVRSFGITQDEATRTNNPTAGSQDISTNTISASASFTNSFPPGSLTLITFSPGAAPAPTTLTLVSGANPSTYGSPVTFTATVRTNGVAVGGISGETVTFYGGAVQIGTGTLNSGGQAGYTTTATQLASGTLSITAVYGGDASFAGSTNSPALSQTVSQSTLTAGLTGTVAKNYNGTVAATLAAGNYTLSGIFAGDTVTLNNPVSGTYDTKNQGTAKTVTVTGLSISGTSASNYVLSSTSASGAVGTINKTNITVTAAANSKTYDGTNSAAATPAITSGALQTGDTANFSETYDTKNQGASKTLTPAGLVNDGNGGNNYNVTFVNNTTGVIMARSLTVTATGVNKPYDGTTAATVNLTDNRVAGDVFTDSYINASFNNKNVADGKAVSVSGISIAGPDAANYTFNTTAGATANITPQAITVTAAANSKTYDGTNSAAVTPAITSGALQTGDTAGFSETYDTKDQGTGKTLTPAGSVNDGNGGGNYDYTFVTSANGTINAATLTYTANPAGMIYGLAVPGLSGSVGGFVGSDTQGNSTAGTLAFITDATSSSSVGAYAVNGSGLTANNGNYTFVQAVGNATALTIGPLPAILTGTRPYDGTATAAAGILSVANQVGSDDVTVASGSGTLVDANVGTQAITSFGSLTLGGAAAGNYTLAGASGSVNITSVGVTLTVTNLLALDRNYDTTTNATLDATNAGLAGILNGDDVTLISSNAVGYFADKNVGTNKPVTVIGLALGGGAAGNYSLVTPTNVTASIGPAGLAVSGVLAANKVYDGTTVASLTGTATLIGVLNSEDVSLVTSNVTALFADPNAGPNKPVAVTGYTLTGLDAGNYSLDQPAGLVADILALTTPAFTSPAISRVPGGFQLSFTAQAGQSYRVLVTGNLTQPVSQWTTLTNGTFGSGVVTVIDTSSSLPARFYRIVSP